ncbi:MAG TPA: hypothetical protein VJ440_12850 [Candidatus Brocadiaceae bacterium]|nr:hypothetical protein [Candidatus Brocadiaceae bacterium]
MIYRNYQKMCINLMSKPELGHERNGEETHAMRLLPVPLDRIARDARRCDATKIRIS